MAETKARHIANLVEDDGDVKLAHLDNTTSATPTAVSDQANTSTGYFDLPAGTTAQRPTLDNAGGTRFNTTTGSLEVYSGTAWIATNEPTPSISSITGNIYSTVATDLTITGTEFNTDNVSIEWLDGSTRIVKEDNITPTSSTSITRAVPSSVYGKSIGTTIGIKVLNGGSVASIANTSKSVLGLPSGGTLDTTSVSGYRIHTFTTSSQFTVPSNVTLSNVEFLVIAGGGSGGYDQGGGGGAGGYRSSVGTESSGGGASAESRLTLTSASSPYTVTVGGGGTGVSSLSNGNDGDPSSFGSLVTTAGGGGGGKLKTNGVGGGSGGGGGGNDNDSTAHTGGTGTSGQGYAGGSTPTSARYAGSGGGGAGGNTGTASGYLDGGEGGVGVESSINGTATYRGGGGGGGVASTSSRGSGGNGGGGAGSTDSTGNAVSGTANTGGGGGGCHTVGSTGGGGSGIVIVRYQLS